MAIVEATRELEPGRAPPIGWEGRRLDEMLADVGAPVRRDRLLRRARRRARAEGLRPDRLREALRRLRGGLVSARETALNISASPIVRELGELCFALYTPEGDSIALSTGIIVHVHTMSDAIKFMVRHGWEDNPGIRPGDIFANNDPTIGDVHNADVQTFVPILLGGARAGRLGGRRHPRARHRRLDPGRRAGRARRTGSTTGSTSRA